MATATRPVTLHHVLFSVDTAQGADDQALAHTLQDCAQASGRRAWDDRQALDIIRAFARDNTLIWW